MTQSPRAELEAQIARIEAELEAERAKLAALEAEPKPLPACPFCGGEAVWRDDDGSLGAFGLIVDHDEECFLGKAWAYEAVIPAWSRRAALPLAPIAHGGMGEAETEALAQTIAIRRGVTGASNLVSIRADDYRNDLVDAICATLSRVPVAAWPGEELRGFREWAASLTVTDMNEIVADNGITAGMVVTQEAAEQVRRLDRLLARILPTEGAAT